MKAAELVYHKFFKESFHQAKGCPKSSPDEEKAAKSIKTIKKRGIHSFSVSKRQGNDQFNDKL